MIGRRIQSDVAHVPDPSRVLDPLLLTSNATLYALARAVVPTSRVVFREPFVERGRPAIYVTWHRMNYVATPVFLALASEDRPTMIVHDGAASRAFSHHSLRWLGFDVFQFHRRAKVPPREQIARYVRDTGRSILNLPDSGGPYGKVKPGTLDVARACGACVVPFVAVGSRVLTVGERLEHVIPLPFGRIDVRRGPALDGTATVDDLQQALDALS